MTSGKIKNYFKKFGEWAFRAHEDDVSFMIRMEKEYAKLREQRNEKMILKNKDDYASSWEWAKDHSKYHFDDTRHDQWGEWTRSLGRFEGDWAKEVADIIEKSKNKIVTWESRKNYKDSNDQYSDMLEQELYDLRKSGAPENLEMANRYDFLEDYPTIWKMTTYFKMKKEHFKPWVHVQMPGQMFNLHIDKLWEKVEDINRPETVSRIVIPLEDWRPGQFYLYGTYHYSHWRAGDIHIFDWPNVPHATANASKFPRPTLVITGVNTQETFDILNNSTAETVHKI